LLVAGLAVRVASPKDSAHFGGLPRSARVFVDPGSATSLSPGRQLDARRLITTRA
jgi:hypothetical protein